MDRTKLLIECGFTKDLFVGGKLDQAMFDKYYVLDEKKRFKLKDDVDSKELEADEEVTEVIMGQHGKTGFPPPVKSYKLSWEVFDLTLEEPYFWVLDVLKGGFPIIEKLEDSFAAAENSAFFGVAQVRLGGQQDKVSQYLAQVGKMIKELFQMVRELRIIDERMAYYEEADKQFEKPVGSRSKSADVTLKGLFVDLVQGGGKSAASVYGMAQNLEFITLPDLFFDAPPFKNTDELDAHVNSLEENFNRNVLRVLIRHLRQYHEWKVRTHKEHKNRRIFMLKYLEQHFQIISMYIEWMKPYLRHTAKLTLKASAMQTADIVSAFEGSIVDVEVMARKNVNGANGIVLATFNYRTKPEMKFVQDGYQRGPVHVGRFQVDLRVYAWTDQQVENYKRVKEMEILAFMGDISTTVQGAMESLGEELTKYLAEARGELKKKEEVEQKKSLLEKMFGDFYTPKEKKAPKVSTKEIKDKEEKAIAALGGMAGFAKFHCWNTFNNFKKAHRMIAW
jgi:hypothetical protein